LPNVNVKALGLGFNELLPGRPAKFVVSISSVWNVDITANIALAGTAVAGVDYTGSSTFTVTIPQGQTLVTNLVVPIDNNTVAPDKTLIYNIASGTGYTNIGAISATNTLRNDDLAPLPILFSDDFETNSAPNWKTNATPTDSDAVFAYDYGTSDGIPIAPHTTNGTTLGLKLRAHFTGANPGGISVSPLGLVLTNDYRLRFDAWLNFNGAAPGGGTGSSEFMTIGMGVSELRTNVAGNASGTSIAAWNGIMGPSVMFTADGDGGFAEATGDYVAYTANSVVALSTNVYPGNSRDNFGAYYGEFGNNPVPAAQTALFPSSQTGASEVGALAFAWHDVIATKVGNLYTLDIDGLRIINLTYTPATVGSNFSLGYVDENNSITAIPQMNAFIADNLTVEKLNPSTNADLASLSLNIGTLVPGFSAGTVSYAVTNGTGTNYTVTATVSHPSGTLQLNVNGGGFTVLTSGVASSTLALNTGANTVVVRVTAPDATTVKDYTLNVVLVSSGPSLTVPTLTSSLSGNTLTLSWPPDHLGFSLQTQTNALSVGLTPATNTWFVVPGSAATTMRPSRWIPPSRPYSIVWLIRKMRFLLK